LHTHSIDIDPRFATTVVCASGGYPGDYRTGLPIHLPEEHADSMIFHAGTKMTDAGLVTSGGRVFAVTSMGDTLAKALDKGNNTAKKITFEGKYFRRDIGFDV
jgi:phosphoribosylamine--glycine ligase